MKWIAIDKKVQQKIMLSFSTWPKQFVVTIYLLSLHPEGNKWLVLFILFPCDDDDLVFYVFLSNIF